MRRQFSHIMFNLILTNLKVSLLVFITTICLIITLFLSTNTNVKKVIKIRQPNIYFDSQSPDSTVSRIKEIKDGRKSDAKNILIHFDTLALDDVYDNIFQTNEDPFTLRLELNHPKIITLIIGNDKSDVSLYKLSDDFALGVWHHIRISINEEKRILVEIDGKKTLDISHPAARYDTSDIVIGAGYNKLRGFQGEIKNFTIEYERYLNTSFYGYFVFLTVCLFITTWCILLARFLLWYYPYGHIEADPAGLMIMPGFALLTVIAGFFITRLFHIHSHWISYLLMGIVFPLVTSLALSSKRLNNSTTLLSWAMTAACASFPVFALLLFKNAFTEPLPLIERVILILIIGTSLLYSLAKAGCLQWSIKKEDWKRSLTITIIVLYVVSFWCGLLKLPNGREFINSLDKRPLATILLFCYFLTVTLYYVFDKTSRPLGKAYHLIWSRWGGVIHLILLTGAFIIFFLLSFRFDTMFIGSSEGHWEYYVGPVRNVKNGSWLLWDTPSQYGFLNILAAAFMPFNHSWQSLYVLQGLLLFVAAAMIFVVFVSKNRTNYFFAFLITVSSLFFADPDLIGPYLFPSSSVMRFIWCYVLLFFFYRTHHSLTTKKFIIGGTFLWIFGFLWSSESAVYTTVIFLSGLIAVIVQDTYRHLRNRIDIFTILKRLFYYLSMSILTLLTVIVIVALYYRVVLGVFPDFRIFIEHGFAYAGGFGSVRLEPYGPIWVLFLLFCAIVSIVITSIMEDPLNNRIVPLVASAGCLWAVSSYFIGRAVPNNITAIYPLLCVITAIVLQSIKGLQFNMFHVVFKVISTPLLVLVMMTSFGNINFIDKLRPFDTLSRDVSQKVRVAEPSLQELISQAGIKEDDPVVFYGYTASMPRWQSKNQMIVSERTWLPNPLQIIEEPIEGRRRIVYLDRFIKDHPQTGYFVRKKGEADERAAQWIALISKTHSPVRIYENAMWKIIYFDLIKS